MEFIVELEVVSTCEIPVDGHIA